MNDQQDSSNYKQYIGDADIEEYAEKDAEIDGTDSLFQRFKARLTELAKIITKNATTSTVREFRDWVGNIRQKFETMSGDIPGSSDIYVTGLETKTRSNLTAAEAKYAAKIIQLGKDQSAWKKRFGPLLQINIDKHSKGSIALLIGLALILLAVESILNSQFFAADSEFGLLGGTLTAITVSCGNVLIPMKLAFFGHRGFYHRDNSYRALGLVMIGLFLLWIFGFNHIVAQYRESLLAAAGQDSSTMNYVLLFALGFVVAGASFWKMWSFLDPYKQARDCENDLKDTKEEFERVVYKDLQDAQSKFESIETEIHQMEVGIPAGFKHHEIDFTRAHERAIAAINKVFAIYHRQYCVMKLDPDPEKPTLTLENMEQYNVGIKDADRNHLAEMKGLLSGLIATATDEWVQKLHALLEKINQLIRKFQTVVTAKMQAWKAQAA